MSSTRRAWIAAVTVGAVQGLKDQGLCRWNHSMARSIHQCAKRNLMGGPLSQSKQLSSSVILSSRDKNQEKMRASEESLRKVMYLSCWGPNN